MKRVIRLVFICCTSSTLVGTALSAQVDETAQIMSWSSLGLGKELNKKTSVYYHQLHAMGLDPVELSFVQSSLKLSYRLNTHWRLYAAYKPLFKVNAQRGEQFLFNRLAAEIQHYTKLGRRFRMKNSLTAEHHFTPRKKFQQRYYYTLRLYYRNTKLPLRLRPYINQKLYWYGGAAPLQYYDEEGAKTNYASPNGFHAYRVQAGIKLYPNKRWSLSIFYQRQQEFNSSFLGGLPIHDLNPNTDQLRRKFYHFSVLGLSSFWKI